MLQCLLFFKVHVEFRIFIPNSFENGDPWVRAEHKNISKQYQAAET